MFPPTDPSLESPTASDRAFYYTLRVMTLLDRIEVTRLLRDPGYLATTCDDQGMVTATGPKIIDAITALIANVREVNMHRLSTIRSESFPVGS